MAIMACTAADAVSGTTSQRRTHVTGGLAYLAKLHARGLDAGVVAAFQEHMVSTAILCEMPVPEHLKSCLENEASADSLEFTFPYYGVSRSFLHAYDRMTKLGTAAHDLTPELERELEREAGCFPITTISGFPHVAASGDDVARPMPGLGSSSHRPGLLLCPPGLFQAQHTEGRARHSPVARGAWNTRADGDGKGRQGRARQHDAVVRHGSRSRV